jgi:predicted PurR-regulated permease PerM
MNYLPLTVRRSIELMGLFILGSIIMAGNIVIMPLLMAFFFSIMLLPVFRFFRKLKVPEVIAVFLPILLFTIFAALIFWLFYSQVSVFVSDFPKIQKNTIKHLDNLSIWIDRSFGYSPNEQIKFINVQSNKLFGSAGKLLSDAAGSVSGVVIFWGIMPIYIYLIILYRSVFVKFILMWFKPAQHQNIEETIHQTEKMVKSYLLGLLIQITYIIILLGGSLMIFGIHNALLIGIIFAFLNLIPYLGALIGNILGILITLASSDNLTDILIVLGAITIVQFLDNNILMPGIVGSQVKINPLVSIAGIFIGGIMAGISGMFLAMPVLSVLKIVFDRSENYKQWGVLLGGNRPAKGTVK